jgi:hypothetical protein
VSLIIEFGLAPPSHTGYAMTQFLTPQQKQRQEHALKMHGATFYTPQAHKTEHERNDLAIAILKGEHPSVLDPSLWIDEIILVAHEHGELEY